MLKRRKGAKMGKYSKNRAILKNSLIRWSNRAIVALFISGFIGLAFGQEDLANWPKSTNIQVNTTPTGANLADNVIEKDFPIVVRLETSFFDFSEALLGGEDIRFSKLDNTPLPYEITQWDSAGGTAVIWVKLDTVKGNTLTEIKMYWGNASAADSSNGAAVFDTTAGYEGVWHLDEDGNTDVGGYLDATSNGRHSTGANFTSESDVAGQIGVGQTFNGTNSYMKMTGYKGITGKASRTVSAWVKFVSEKNNTIMYWGAASGLGARWTIRNQETKNSGELTAGALRLEVSGGWNVGSVVINDGTWHHISVVLVDNNNPDVNEGLLYVDGILETSGKSLTKLVNTSNSADVQLGRGREDKINYFDGIMDEARISSVVRSTDWVKLSYENQKTGQTVVGVKLPNGCYSADEAFDTTSIVRTVASLEVVTLGVPSNCATSKSWTLVRASGDSALGVTDTIQYTTAGGGNNDTLTFKYTAGFVSGTTKEKTFTVIVSGYAQPVFTLAGTVASPWNGTDTLTITATITNLAALTAPNMPALVYTWGRTGVISDTIFSNTELKAANAQANGATGFTLCINNGAANVCDTVNYTVSRIVPTPIFNITGSKPNNSVWNGQDTLVLLANISNYAALTAPGMPPLTVTWTRAGVFLTLEKTDTSASLSQPLGDGALNVGVCLNYFGKDTCQSLAYSVRISTSAAQRAGLKMPMEIKGNVLIWNLPSSIKVYSMNGKLLLNKSGRMGDTYKLSNTMAQQIKTGRLIVKITQNFRP